MSTLLAVPEGVTVYDYACTSIIAFGVDNRSPPVLKLEGKGPIDLRRLEGPWQIGL